MVDQNLLVIFVDSGDLHVACKQNVRVLAGITYLVDALPWSKGFETDLGGQDGNFIIVEQGKERYVF